MSTFGSTPHSGPGTHGNAPVDPATSPDTDEPPTEPSLDASELEDDDDEDEDDD